MCSERTRCCKTFWLLYVVCAPGIATTGVGSWAELLRATKGRWSTVIIHQGGPSGSGALSPAEDQVHSGHLRPAAVERRNMNRYSGECSPAGMRGEKVKQLIYRHVE